MNRWLLGMFSLWSAAGFLAFFISTRIMDSSAYAEAQDPLYRLLGSSKEAIGDTLFMKANAYYHGGVAEKFEEDAASHAREGFLDSGKETVKRRVGFDWIANVNHQRLAHEHYHLDKSQRKEMLPFLALSTRLDPHNIEAVLTTAYWLDAEFGKTEEAIALLIRGIEDNPESWELESRLAYFYFHRKKDFASSKAHYLEAIRKSQGKDIENFKVMDHYYYLAESYVELNQKNEAVQAYRRAMDYYDQDHPAALREMILKKIEGLSQDDFVTMKTGG